MSARVTKCDKNNRLSRAEKPRCDVVRSSDKKLYEQTIVFGKELTAILDTGSDLNLIRASVYIQLGAPQLSKQTIPFESVSAISHRTLGRFRADVIIDGLIFTLNIDVVPDQFLGQELLIGGELSEQAELRISHRQVAINKIKQEDKVDESIDVAWRAVLSMNVTQETNDGPDVSIQHIKNAEVKEKVKEIVENYVPIKSSDTGVEMRIVLHDDAPVYQNPRRLSAEQKKNK